MYQWTKSAWVFAGIVASAIGTASVRAEDLNRSPLSLDVLSLQASPPSGKPHSVAEGTKVRIRGFGVWSTASGSVDFENKIPAVEHDIDFEDTLGMDLDQFTGGALVGFDFGRFHLDLRYNGYYDYDGDRTLGSIIFDDNVYTGRVTSAAKIHDGAVEARYDFWKADGADLTLSANLAVHLYHVDASIKEVLTGRSDSIEFWAPVPTLGLGVRWGLTDNLYVSGTAGGIYAGDLVTYYDLSAEVGYDFNRNFGVFVGYRYWSIEVEYNNDEFDLSNGAFYGGAEVRF